MNWKAFWQTLAIAIGVMVGIPAISFGIVWIAATLGTVWVIGLGLLVVAVIISTIVGIIEKGHG